MPTTNPVPSLAPSDMLFNVSTLDSLINSDLLVMPKRLGGTVLTWAGVVAALNAEYAMTTTGANSLAAQAARVAAENARDAALIQAGVYATEAAGRAAVADGQAFKVQGDGVNVAAYEYRRVNSGTVSTLIGTYPSKAAVDAVARKADSIASFTDVDRYTNSTVQPGYRNKDTGAYVPAGSWVSIVVPYNAKHEYRYTATGNASLVGLVIAIGASNNWLGTLDASASASSKLIDPALVPVGTVSLAFSAIAANAHTAFERVYSVEVGALGAIPGQIATNAANVNLMLKTAAQVDYALDAGVRPGYINLAGAYVANASWKTTPRVEWSEASEILLSAFGNTGLVSTVSMFDSNDVFLGPLYKTAVQVTNLPITSALPDWNPACTGVRASGAISGSNVFAFKVTRKNIDESLLPSLLALKSGVPTSVRKLVPVEVYGRVNEKKYLYARQIVCDPSLDLAWNIPISNDLVAEITPTSTADIPLEIRGMGRDGAGVTLASFVMKVSPEALVNPASDRFVCMIGDSTNFSIIGATGGTSAPAFQASYPNELSRLLSGVGRPILVTGDSSPTALGMTSLKFIGTLGNEIVKCEGRPGWSTDDYLTQAVGPGGLTNAFWNPGASQFDMAYYCAQNGFTSVAADGSNLTIILDLGWNKVYSESAAASAAMLGTLVDRIHATHPLADILIVGLNPPPKVIRKAYTDSRYVSPAQIFQKAIVEFGSAFRAMAATKTRCYFLQVSQEYDVERAYPKLSQQTSIRSPANFLMSTDYVHPGLEGYAMKADAVRSWMIWKYCRGV